MGPWWEFDADGVIGVYRAACEDDGHDAGAAGLLACGVSRSPEVLLQAVAMFVDLRAGGAETGDFDDGFGAEMEFCMQREREEFDAAGEDVFADLSGLQRKAEGGEFVEHLGGEEVDLREVGLRWILALQVHVLRGGAAVRVAFNTFPGDEVE
jgi:hypothetical protein